MWKPWWKKKGGKCKLRLSNAAMVKKHRDNKLKFDFQFSTIWFVAFFPFDLAFSTCCLHDKWTRIIQFIKALKVDLRYSWGPLTWYNNIWRLLGSVLFHENFEYLKENSEKVLSSKRWKNCNVSVRCFGWVCRTKLGSFNMLNVRYVSWNEFDYCDAYRNRKTFQTIWSKYFESKPLKFSLSQEFMRFFELNNFDRQKVRCETSTFSRKL